ncbi:hypothetical protein TD95_001656 [Thielaviopsis punctulata]|uniref:Beta-xylanase n=1 Tax=Thielaviopsis punctulata TaxID=72032 RepID=A0A0F4ZI52_9PEZI|nr:hypothetical protein TD95_001656 [Thielaviopsis punctulata]
MKSVAINALLGLLATSGAVDARHRHHRRSCKASSVLSSAVATPTADASSVSRTLTVTPLLSTLSLVPTPSSSASSAAATTLLSSVVPSVTSAAESAAPTAADSSSVAAPSSTASATKSASTPLSTNMSLNDLWKAHGHLYVGAATDENLLIQYGEKEKSVLQSEYGQITPENSMKWDAIEPTLNNFDFSAADYTVAYAESNNMIVRGHTLVWHEQLPDYVSNITDKDTLKEVMVNHITTVMKHYKGKVYSWDVLNEIFNYDGTMRQTVFYNVIGEEYVSIAFNAARAADPNAKLYINEYGLDSPDAAKLVNGMVPKMKQWLAEGIPIDGIGSQSHLIGGEVSTVPAAIQALADTGVEEIGLTEMDISGAASADYVTVFNGCLAVPKCVGITIWGVSDADAWRSGAVLFNDDFQPKPAVAALKEDMAS